MIRQIRYFQSVVRNNSFSEAVRLMVIGGQGFMPAEGVKKAENATSSLSRIPLFRGDARITRNYCAFWKQDNSGYYVEEFAEILSKKFE